MEESTQKANQTECGTYPALDQNNDGASISRESPCFRMDSGCLANAATPGKTANTTQRQASSTPHNGSTPQKLRNPSRDTCRTSKCSSLRDRYAISAAGVRPNALPTPSHVLGKYTLLARVWYVVSSPRVDLDVARASAQSIAWRSTAMSRSWTGRGLIGRVINGSSLTTGDREGSTEIVNNTG